MSQKMKMKKGCRWKCKRGPHIPHHKESICLMITHTASYPSGLFPKAPKLHKRTRYTRILLQDLFLYIICTTTFFLLLCPVRQTLTLHQWGGPPVALLGAFFHMKRVGTSSPLVFFYGIFLNGLNLWDFA